MSWKNLQTVQKGDIGELIVYGIISEMDLAIYRPDPGSHPMDFICYDNNAKTFVGVEVKTYCRQYRYENTGIDSADFDHYLEHCFDVQLFFVDAFEEMVYFQSIVRLKKSARRMGAKTYFPLSEMRPYRRLTRFEVDKIKSYSTVNWKLYEKTERYFDDKIV